MGLKLGIVMKIKKIDNGPFTNSNSWDFKTLKYVLKKHTHKALKGILKACLQSLQTTEFIMETMIDL